MGEANREATSAELARCREEVEALRRREERARAALELASVGDWEFETWTDRVWASPQALRIYGWPPDQGVVDRATLLHAIHPDDRDRTRRALWDAVARGERFAIEHRIVRRDGAVRIVCSRGRAERVAEGLRVFGAVQDVTETRRVAEERERLVDALAAEHRWLDTLIDRLPVAVLLVGERGELRANERAQYLLGPIPPGSTPAAILPRVCDAQGHPIEWDRMPLVRAMRGESVHAEELHFLRPGGEKAVALVSAGPIESAQGEQLGAVCALEDVTRLKELERMREEWTSVVAHDLRQPVTVIHAHAQMLARHGASDAGADARIAHILAAARQLDRMIGDLLDVSRIETRRLSLRLEPVEVEPLARAVAERMEKTLEGHLVAIHAANAVPPVCADPLRVEQILSNLLSNAARYGRKGGRIDVDIARDRAWVRVQVTNEGPGIAPEEMPSLFTRFFRTPAARARSARGLGLGLYITRGLVEAHGGTIFAASEPGARTTFTFTLPIAEVEGDAGET